MSVSFQSITSIMGRLSLMIVFMFALIGCSDDDPNDIIPEQPKDINITLSKSSVKADALAVSDTIKITANGSWTAETSDTWFSISPNSGTTNSNAIISVKENDSTTQRTGTITFVTQTGRKTELSVQQVGKSLSISDNSLTFDAEGGSQELTVSAHGNYEISEPADWLSLVREGDKLILYAEENLATEQRVDTLTLTMLGLTSEELECKVSICQFGTEYHFDIDQTSIKATSSETIEAISLTTNDEWTATTSDGNWLNLSSNSGKKSQLLTLVIGENKSTYPRSGAITLVGVNSGLTKTIEVTQDGKYLTVDKSELFMGNEGGTEIVTISTDGSLTAETDVNWITATLSGQQLTVKVEQNPNKTDRSGNVIIKMTNLTSGKLSQTIKVTQSKTSYVFQVDAQSLHATSVASTQEFTLTTNDDWTASSSVSWLTLSSTSGSGNQKFVVSFAENTTTAERKGTIVLKGKNSEESKEINVTQDGKYLTVSPTTLDFNNEEGSSAITVDTDGTFKADKNVDWITLSINGKVITVTVAANKTTTAREGKVTITMTGLTSGSISQTVKVSQSSTSYSFKTDITKIAATSAATEQTIQLSTNDDWTATCSAAWVTLSANSGTGNAAIKVSLSENTTPDKRTTTIVLKGTNSGQKISVSVSQDGKYLTVSPTTLSFTCDEGSANITVSTDGNFKTEKSVDWISLTTNGNTVLVSVSENAGTTKRTGKVTISMTDLTSGSISKTVTVSQSEKTYSLKTDITEIASASAAKSQDIKLTTNDAWTATSSASWVTLSATSGSGDATIKASIAENTTPDKRTVTVTIKGTNSGLKATIKVSQDGKYLTVTPASLTFTSNAGSSPVTVSTDGTFKAEKNVDWISLSTNGNNVTVSVTENTGTTSREGKVTVSMTGLTSGTISRVVTVSQSSKSYTFKTDITSITATSASKSQDIKLTTNDSWTATSSANWVTLSATSGSGDATIKASIAENKTPDKRTATVTLQGTNCGQKVVVNVTQDGKYLTVTPESLNFTSNAGSSTLAVSTDGTFKAEKNVDWISLSTNGNTVTVSVTENTGTTSREGKVTVSMTGLTTGTISRVVTVSQSSKSYTFKTDITSITATSAAKSQDIKLTTNDSWTATSSANWATLSATSGSGDATIKASIAENTTPDKRTATVTLQGTNCGQKVVVNVTQDGKYLTVTPESLTFTSNAGSSTLAVSTDGTFKTEKNVDWISLSTNGNNVTVSVTENTGTTSREGKVTVSMTGLTSGTISRVVTVSQSSKSYTFKTDITSITATSAAKSQDIKLTTNDSWTATSSANWVTLSATSGSGDATIKASIAENKTPDKRTATVTLQGKYSGEKVIVNVTQDGKYLTVTPESLTYTSNAGSSTLAVSTDGTFKAEKNVDWISLSTNGNNVTVSVTENTGTTSREGKVTVSMTGLTSGTISRVVTVSQSSKSYTFKTDITSITATSAAKSQDIKLTTNDSWTATSSANWVTLSASSGSGDATIKASIAENTTPDKRTATITLQGKNSGEKVIVNVAQDGKYLTVSPSALSFGQKSSSQTITVTTDGTFSATCSANWITLTQSGNIITVKASDNNNAEARNTTITVSLTNLTSGKLSSTIKVDQSAGDSEMQIQDKEADKNQPALAGQRKK